jgi:heme oxygenase
MQNPSRTDRAQLNLVPLGLRARLKAETRDLQVEAERSGIMRTVLYRRIERAAYCRLLRNLHEIYAGLEAGFELHARHPQLAPIVFRALFRVGHLESDLRQLAGSSWATSYMVTPAVNAYRRRLDELAESRPGLLAAHAYVRYLGDLGGGQVVHQLVAEQLSLGDNALRFYQFGSAQDVDLLVAHFRAGFDAIPASAADAEAIVEEARQAFRRHIEIYAELG